MAASRACEISRLIIVTIYNNDGYSDDRAAADGDGVCPDGEVTPILTVKGSYSPDNPTEIAIATG